MLSRDTLKKWETKDLWSAKELEELCCGLEPDTARPNTKCLNDAREAIARAVLAKSLLCIDPIDADRGDRLYGHSRFFKPVHAINWATGRFPDFPDFSSVEKPHTASSSTSWPWGDYETDLLRKLAAAAEKFWVNYDPEDHTTAPKNETVKNWLKDHQVSDRVADVMATILRPDGLPTGPRK